MKFRPFFLRLQKQVSIVQFILLLAGILAAGSSQAQAPQSRKISTDLFGLFFEDINYAADGGLYAELVQNRSFEYNPTERREWHPLSFWEYQTPGYSYGQISVETSTPVHANNPHYLVLNAEHIGHEEKYQGESGVGIKNSGFGGMVVKAGETYHFSAFLRQLSAEPVSLKLSLQNPKGEILASTVLSTTSGDWTQYKATLTPSANEDSASLVVMAVSKGKIAIDMVSLFPQSTFKNRPNGLRADLAQLLDDIKPGFIRFPGGCLVHGDGLANMYRWKNSIGPIEQRVEQRNIWGYHQSVGLGYYEYFQLCEDIGAKPLPVLPAAVSCQNSGGTWRVGGTGQKAMAMEDMKDYIQEVLDLVEWANGPVTSTWGAKRAAAGHPEPFHLQYIGIGNEDKITPEFNERFTMIYKAVKAQHPEITVVGTAGPFHSGEDYDKGWAIANKLEVPVMDEHYYTDPAWFISNQYRYDKYDRKASQVYLGEYASWGNKMKNALAEAVYLTSLERNGDVVRMASYAPLFAKKNFTQWSTDMIFFDNKSAILTPNYYVQKMFSANRGDTYYANVISTDLKDSAVAASCIKDSKTGDLVLKLVNAGKEVKTAQINLANFKIANANAEQTVLAGDADLANTFEHPQEVIPSATTIQVKKNFAYQLPASSLTVIRIKTKK